MMRLTAIRCARSCCTSPSPRRARDAREIVIFYVAEEHWVARFAHTFGGAIDAVAGIATLPITPARA